MIISQTKRWEQLFQTDTTVVEICASIVPQHDEGGLKFLRGTRSFVFNEGNMSFFCNLAELVLENEAETFIYFCGLVENESDVSRQCR